MLGVGSEQLRKRTTPNSAVYILKLEREINRVCERNNGIKCGINEIEKVNKEMLNYSFNTPP